MPYDMLTIQYPLQSDDNTARDVLLGFIKSSIAVITSAAVISKIDVR